MASGHVHRIKRPNTWLQRPTVKKALAKPEPSTHGALFGRQLFGECPLCAAGSIGQRNTLIFSKDGVWT
jgi:hypothetical protein